MKIFIIFSVLVYFVVCAPTINESFQNDISDFLEIIPVEKIKKIAIKHLHDDPEFQAAIKRMTSPEWIEMVLELKKQPEVIELKNFLKEAGFDIDEFGAKFCSFFKEAKIETDHPVKSLSSFIAEVKQIVPMAKLIDTFDNKLTNSPAFKEFYEKITSEKAHELVSKVRALPLFQKLAAEVTEMGIDIDRIFKIMYAVFGWVNESLQQPKPIA